MASFSSPFDPASLNDAIASKTSWSPASRSSSNFRTHRFKEISWERYEFVATAGASLFCLLFLGIGLAFLTLCIATWTDGNMPGSERFIFLLMGLVFAIAGGSLFYVSRAPLVFDQGAGFFWRGWQKPPEFAEQNITKRFTRLDRIHAIQLLSRRIRSSESPYTCYELNLVLKDSQRINVLCHGSREHLRSDATELGAFLGVPVWDKI